jgi:predicted O-methyltransferase YrrM
MDIIANLHRQNKTSIYEGHIGRNKAQIAKLKDLCATHNFKNILEIGFNAGHSSALMLENSNACIVSVDICAHPYTYDGKEVIDEIFPERHLLIKGNSMEVLATDEVPALDYDLIYIDGGHSYGCCKSDLLLCRKYASPDTIIIVDDIVYDPLHRRRWNKQVTKVWGEMKMTGFVQELEYCYFDKGQGFAVGRYRF